MLEACGSSGLSAKKWKSELVAMAQAEVKDTLASLRSGDWSSRACEDGGPLASGD